MYTYLKPISVGCQSAMAPVVRWTFAYLAVAICWSMNDVRAQDTALPLVPSDHGQWGVGHQVLSNPGDPFGLDVWYPVDISERDRGSEFCSGRAIQFATRNGLDPPICTQYETDELTVYPEFKPWEALRSSKISVEAATIAPETFPLVVYGHGAAQTTTANTTLPESLASHGFFVAAPQQDFSQAIQFLLDKSDTEGDQFHSRISSRIGVSGSSAGSWRAFQAASEEFEQAQVEAVLSIAGEIPSHLESSHSEPTLFVIGRRDPAVEEAKRDFARLGPQDKYMAITPTAHGGPTWDAGHPDSLRMTNLYAVSFFTSTLKDDDRYEDVLSEKYVWEYESKRESDQLYFFDTAVTDADGDGRTGFADFLILKAHFAQPVPSEKREGTLGLGVGDFSLNGVVDFQDFLLLANNFSGDVNLQNSSVSVPEPSSIVLILTTLVGVRKLLSTRSRRAVSREDTPLRRMIHHCA